VLEPGQLVDGKYRVERLLGQGGMGAVFEGYHTLVDRRVAIKVLLPDATSSEHGAARFEREVRATGRIGNDHILEVYDVGVLPDGSRYMVSEFLDGETLSDRLERGPLQPKVAAELTLQLLDGLGAAHAKGIVHRDLKPENLFLLRHKAGRADFLKIIDFGISKFQLDDMSAMSMTATGTVLGTPYYLSPEQARGHRDIDHRSDLYTVGVILYQTVLGRVPVHAESFNELLFKIALESPPPLKTLLPQLDPAFSDIVEHAMARKREDRYQNAAEMRLALAKWLELPTSGAHVAIPSGSGAARAPWDSGETVTGSLLLPTNSNFGLTSGQAFRRTSRVRIALIVVGVLGVIGVSAALLLKRGSGDASVASSAVASSPVPASPSASAPIVIAPADPFPTPAAPEQDDSALRGTLEPDSKVVDDGPLSGLPSRADLAAKRQGVTPRPQRPATAPVTPRAPATAAPTPAPATSGKRRRDFGY
jgi:eukaryotic-like serine/threonine-protein kinase